MTEIRRLRMEHLDRLKAFFAEINVPRCRVNFSPHPFDDENAVRVCGCPGRDLYYGVTLDGGEIIAYGMLRGWDEGYAVPAIGLCVIERFQGRGIGRLLLTFLETAAALEGADEVMLKVRKSNGAAKRLYEEHGYAFIEHNEDFLVGRKALGRRGAGAEVEGR